MCVCDALWHDIRKYITLITIFHILYSIPNIFCSVVHCTHFFIFLFFVLSIASSLLANYLQSGILKSNLMDVNIICVWFFICICTRICICLFGFVLQFFFSSLLLLFGFHFLWKSFALLMLFLRTSILIWNWNCYSNTCRISIIFVFSAMRIKKNMWKRKKWNEKKKWLNRVTAETDRIPYSGRKEATKRRKMKNLILPQTSCRYVTV